MVAGKPHGLGVYGNVQKDCTSGPLPTVRVVTPPKHGELNVHSGKLKAGRISRCPKLEATAQGVFYKPNPSYKGADEVSYEVKSASGKIERHAVRITVKEATPADVTSNPDADAEL
ncbi:4-aminobutyrate aminotransferase [Microvirga soli]|uniref:4-aminobutyrate aminotransferase n=1 Tax=Microvirga soli TaxID=1854496 RepID=UPI00191D29FF|nr:4-aminobutyrate aminotransferase [Microvirga soli]